MKVYTRTRTPKAYTNSSKIPTACATSSASSYSSHVAQTVAFSLGLITPTLTATPLQAETVPSSSSKIIRNAFQVEKVTKAIVDIFKDYVISYDLDRSSVDSTSSTMPESITGFDKLEERIRYFVQQNKRIELFVVGFPFKSGNRDKKTIGRLPDMAERSTFVYLNKFLSRINNIYSEGVRLNIVCDGVAFADILGIPDQHVVDYERTLCQLASDMPALRFITSKHLSEGFPSLQALRDYIDYLPPTQKEALVSIETSSDVQNALHTMLKRLAVEFDYDKGMQLIREKGLEAVTTAAFIRQMRLRHFIKALPELKDMIRLTVHFQKDVSEKFGIKVSENSNILPYHGVYVVDADGTSFLRQKMDVDMGKYELVSESIHGVWCPYFKEKS